MKQVLKSPNKSTVINDSIKNHSHTEECRKTSITSLAHIEIRKSKLNQTVTWNDMKIEDRVRCPRCFKHHTPGETWCTCGSMLQGIAEKIKKEAEQRINSRVIMYAFETHNLALKNAQRGRRLGNFAEYQNSINREIIWVPQRNKITERSWTLPRGRAAPNVHARTRTHSIRHERI